MRRASLLLLSVFVSTSVFAANLNASRGIGSAIPLFRGDEVAVSSFLPRDAQTAGTSALTPSTATLNASVNSHGLATTAHFDWGVNQASPASTTTQNIGSNDFAVNVSAAIGGMQAGTTYSYRIVATNAAGTTTSAWAQFTTPIPRTITIESNGPLSGVAISVVSGGTESGGTTPFAHTYYQGSTLTLTAPANSPTGAAFQFWYSSGARVPGGNPLTWTVNGDATVTAVYNVARGDIDQSHTNDLLFENRLTGARAAWLLSNTPAYLSTANLPTLTDVNWQIVASADFSGDGSSDILLRNYSTGANAVWLMRGTTYLSTVNLPALPDTNFRFCGIADFNHDGFWDILVRNPVTGVDAIWLMNGTALASVANLPTLAGMQYIFAGTRDFNSNADNDIVIRNTATGDNAIWLMNGTTFSGVIINLPALPDTNYELSAVSDYDQDGFRDLVWRNKVTGANAIWLMNGYTVNTIVNLPTLADTNWHMTGPR
jgi:hypothetical protein